MFHRFRKPGWNNGLGYQGIKARIPGLIDNGAGRL
jgi:hypothetical protein